MPEKKKTTVGQQFMKLLSEASKNKDNLLNLACAIIRRSPSKRTLKERGLPKEVSAVHMVASVAKLQATRGRDVSTDGMLMMVMDTYRTNKFGTPDKFEKDFAKKFPQEYGADKTPPRQAVNTTPTIQQTLARQLVKNR